MKSICEIILCHTRRFLGEKLWKNNFPYAYARYLFRHHKNKSLSYSNPRTFEEKLFWLARYWQDPRIVQCADKLTVRQYVKDQGLDYILNDVYKSYDSVNQIDFEELPSSFVLKANHLGGGKWMTICKDKSLLDIKSIRQLMCEALNTTIGIDTAEYHYQYIKPKIFAEKFIGLNSVEKYEIQFFCFNGEPKHILVRNDLGDAAEQSFAISYDMNWNRVQDRKCEDMSISIPKPKKLNEMIAIAAKLSAPFPQVRIDLYYVDEQIIFGEMTFTTSGNILFNYTEQTIKKWGEELVLPEKLKTKWSKVYKSYKQ